jgi:hypothetical protein
MITSEQTVEKLLLTFYYLKNRKIDPGSEEENIFKDKELADEFTRFLKDSFEMQVPVNKLSEKKMLDEALEAIIPYLPEDTTQLYSKMADIYCCVCEALDDQVAELFLIDWKKDIAKIGAIAGALIAIVYATIRLWDVNAETVLSAYNQFEQLKPFAWLSSGAWFYLCIMLFPIIGAFIGGVLSRFTYRLYHYVRYRI